MPISKRYNVRRHWWGRLELADFPFLILSLREDLGEIGWSVHTCFNDVFRNCGHVAQINSVCARYQGDGEGGLEEWFIPARESASGSSGLYEDEVMNRKKICEDPASYLELGEGIVLCLSFMLPRGFVVSQHIPSEFSFEDDLQFGLRSGWEDVSQLVGGALLDFIESSGRGDLFRLQHIGINSSERKYSQRI